MTQLQVEAQSPNDERIVEKGSERVHHQFAIFSRCETCVVSSDRSDIVAIENDCGIENVSGTCASWSDCSSNPD